MGRLDSALFSAQFSRSCFSLLFRSVILLPVESVLSRLNWLLDKLGEGEKPCNLGSFAIVHLLRFPPSGHIAPLLRGSKRNMGNGLTGSTLGKGNRFVLTDRSCVRPSNRPTDLRLNLFSRKGTLREICLLASPWSAT